MRIASRGGGRINCERDACLPWLGGADSKPGGFTMQRGSAVLRRVIGYWILAFIGFALCALPPAARAAPVNGAIAASAAQLRDELSPLLQVNVICQRVREGKMIRTYSCPDRNTCVNVAGAWKCRPPGAALMACSVCYANQKRDFDSCVRSGTLMQQSACVNRVNGELMKCLGHCR